MLVVEVQLNKLISLQRINFYKVLEMRGDLLSKHKLSACRLRI
jgi:hypothetical protein